MDLENLAVAMGELDEDTVKEILEAVLIDLDLGSVLPVGIFEPSDKRND